MINNQGSTQALGLTQLQADIRHDLQIIPNLKMGILSARDLYGSLGKAMLIVALGLLVINTGLQCILRMLGLFTPPLSVGLFCGTASFAIIGGLLLGNYLSQFILFSKLVKGQLKTEAFIKTKFRQLGLAYMLMYSVFYAILSVVFNASWFMDATDWSAFSLVLPQFLSRTVSMLLLGVLANMEVERLGIGAMFDIIQIFIRKAKNNPLTPTDSEHA